MSAIGDYVHYTWGGYRLYGTDQPWYARRYGTGREGFLEWGGKNSSDILRYLIEEKDFFKDRFFNSLRKEDVKELEAAINAMYSEEALKSYAKLHKDIQVNFDEMWDRIAITLDEAFHRAGLIGDLRSLIDPATMTVNRKAIYEAYYNKVLIDVKRTQAGRGKVRTIVENGNSNLLKNLKKIEEEKVFLQKNHTGYSEEEVQIFIKKANEIQQDFEKIIADAKAAGGYEGKGRTKFVKNNIVVDGKTIGERVQELGAAIAALSILKGGDTTLNGRIAKFEGDLMEVVVKTAAEMAVENTKGALGDFTTKWSGTSKLRHQITPIIGMKFETTAKMPKFMKNLVKTLGGSEELIETDGGWSLMTKNRTQVKADVLFRAEFDDLNDLNVGLSVKNYADLSNVHVVSSTSLFLLVQDLNTETLNNALNIFALHPDETRDVSMYRERWNEAFLTLAAINAIYGGEGRENQSGVANYIVVNDKSKPGFFKVIDLTDIFIKILNNGYDGGSFLKGITFQVPGDKEATVSFVGLSNKRVGGEASSNSQKFALRRIYNLLAELHARKVNVMIDLNELT